MVTLYLCAFKEDRGRSSFAAPVTKVVKASNSLELSVHHAQWHFKNDAYASHMLAILPLQSYHGSHAVSAEQQDTEGRHLKPPME